MWQHKTTCTICRLYERKTDLHWIILQSDRNKDKATKTHTFVLLIQKKALVNSG